MAAMQASRKSQNLGEATWAKMPKVNAELFSLTYGAMVSQVCEYANVCLYICVYVHMFVCICVYMRWNLLTESFR